MSDSIIMYLECQGCGRIGYVLEEQRPRAQEWHEYRERIRRGLESRDDMLMTGLLCYDCNAAGRGAQALDVKYGRVKETDRRLLELLGASERNTWHDPMLREMLLEDDE